MTVDRMLIRQLVKMLLLTLGVLLTLAMVSEFFETSRHVLSGKGTTGEVLLFYLTRISPLLYLLLPISLVVATFVTFAILGHANELRALAAAGYGPLRLAAPVALIAMLGALSAVAVGEYLVPLSLDRMERLMSEKFGRIDSSWRFFTRRQWIRGEQDRIFYVGGRSPDGSRLRAAVLLELDPDFHLRRRTDANRANWHDGQWKGRRVQVREFESGELKSFSDFRQKTLEWTEQPERFQDLRGRPKQKRFSELVGVIRELQRRGMPTLEYRLELHNRFAFPFLGLGLILLAIPVLVAPGRRRTLATALLEAIGLIFLAYVLVGLSTSAVSAGALSPAIGAWLPLGIVVAAALLFWVPILRRRLSGSPA